MLQGIGLGAEVPIVLTYVLEFVPARRRGSLSAGAVSLWQFAGLLAALIAIVIIPAFTWRGMFFAASILSLIMMIFLAFIPESVRYLVKQGRVAEAERVVRRFSSVLPENVVTPQQHVPLPTASIRDILRGRYLRFTLGAWIMSAAWGMAYFGMSVWLPSILIKMGFTQIHSFAYTAAITGFGATGVLVSGTLMDRFGRRATTAACFLIGGLSMIAWSLMTTPAGILFFGMLTTFAGTGGVAGCLFTYICEIYPTQFRASGSGLATVWQRIGGAIAPIVLGASVGSQGAVFKSFILLGGVLIIGALAALLLTYETGGRSLEEITTDLAST
jgi:MFS transporter, putative metabolite:H+ symporter